MQKTRGYYAYNRPITENVMSNRFTAQVCARVPNGFMPFQKVHHGLCWCVCISGLVPSLCVCVRVRVCALYLHGIVGVFVVEDECLLDQLVVSLQFVNVGFVVNDVLLVCLQVVHLFLQRAGNVHRHVTNLLHTHKNVHVYISCFHIYIISSFFLSPIIQVTVMCLMYSTTLKLSYMKKVHIYIF